MQIKTSQKIVRKIKQICEDNPVILAAYLFGSVVQSKGREPKDIDIAVLLDEFHIGRFELPSFITLVEKQIEQKTDVVVLNRAGEVLKYEVRLNGHLIFERSPEMRKSFEIKSRKTYEDFLHLHNRYVNKVLYGR